MERSQHILKFGKSQTDQQENIREVSKISRDKLSPMPEKSAFTFHHNFYPKPKVVLEVLQFR